MKTDTLALALRIAGCLETETPEPQLTNGRKVIVRGDRSGVFYGTLVSEQGQTVELTSCRHVWYWSGAANTAEMALSGVSKPNDCKIIAPVSRLRVLDAIEIIDCTPVAIASMDAVPSWSKK
jgi:hypothetical protein